MKPRLSVIRAAAPVAVFVVELILGSAIASLWGGLTSFVWMLWHGLLGPFAEVALHYGKLSAEHGIVSLFVVVSLAVQVRYPSYWTMALSILCLAVWPIFGWGTAV